MKMTEVKYRALRATKQFENDTAEVTVQLEEGDDPQAALERARQACTGAIAAGQEAAIRSKIDAVMSDPKKRAELEALLTRLGSL